MAVFSEAANGLFVDLGPGYEGVCFFIRALFIPGII